MRVREDYRTLSGPEKAAILMLSLGEEQAAKIFEYMDDDEIMELSQTMATLGKISPAVVERLFVDFAEQMSSTNTLIGTQDSTERLLSKAGMSKDKIDTIMEEIRGPAGRTMWEKLGNVNEEILSTFLQKEYPQSRRCAFKAQYRPRRACSGDAAREFRARSYSPYAADGSSAERDSGRS